MQGRSSPREVDKEREGEVKIARDNKNNNNKWNWCEFSEWR